MTEATKGCGRGRGGHKMLRVLDRAPERAATVAREAVCVY